MKWIYLVISLVVIVWIFYEDTVIEDLTQPEPNTSFDNIPNESEPLEDNGTDSVNQTELSNKTGTSKGTQTHVIKKTGSAWN